MSAGAAPMWLALCLLAMCSAQLSRVVSSSTRDRLVPTSDQMTDMLDVSNTASYVSGRQELYEGQDGGVGPMREVDPWSRRGNTQTKVVFFFFFFFLSS
jgi:hypothetical protein